MKRCIFKTLLGVVVIVCLVIILNIGVTTKQCINYECHSFRIPIYIKIFEFLDRHYNYASLTKSIIRDARSDEERVIKILAWMQSNIKRAPEGFPIIDDHVWHIIIRRYAVDDQFQDVFTALCNYAQLNAFFSGIKSEDGVRIKPLSFVKLKRGWSVFDACYGVYFKNRRGEIANIEDLLSGDWQAFSISNKEIPDYYPEYFKNLQKVNYANWKFSRSAIQSPASRFIYWIKGKK